MTKQRRMIREIIDSADGHPTAEEIFVAARKRIPNIARGTVYRNLAIMEEEGEVGKVVFPSAPARYDKTGIRHGHLVCGKCGRMTDLPLEGLTDYLKDVTEGPVLDYRLTVYTVCEKCRKKSDG